MRQVHPIDRPLTDGSGPASYRRQPAPVTSFQTSCHADVRAGQGLRGCIYWLDDANGALADSKPAAWSGSHG